MHVLLRLQMPGWYNVIYERARVKGLSYCELPLRRRFLPGCMAGYLSGSGKSHLEGRWMTRGKNKTYL